MTATATNDNDTTLIDSLTKIHLFPSGYKYPEECAVICLQDSFFKYDGKPFISTQLGLNLFKTPKKITKLLLHANHQDLTQPQDVVENFTGNSKMSE